MTKNHPLIGIPCRADISATYHGRPIEAQNASYLNAIIEAGGLPILIPLKVQGDMLESLFEQLDALLFTGGGDVDPSYYDQSPQVRNIEHVQRERDELELELVRMAIEAGKPFFAICRGIQVMNVASGGNLWQDLTSQCPHTFRHDYFYEEVHYPRNYIAHEINLERSSLLNKILGTERLAVNSLHHQAVREVGPPLKVTGRADDGVVEVLEVQDHPFGLGVQWHPEELVAEHETARQMFAAFIDAAQHFWQNGGG